MQAGTTNLLYQDGNVYRGRPMAAEAESKADQLAAAREQQNGLPVFPAPLLGTESLRSATVAPEIRQCLAALLINIDACRRWLSADPPDIQQAGAAMDRMTGNANALTRLVGTSGYDNRA